MSLHVRNLTLRRGGRRLIDDVGFEAPAGRVLAVLGPNGAGKTTLLALIAGLLRADTGELGFAGAPLPFGSARRLATSRAVMTQHFDCPFDFTVEEVVALGRIVHAGTPRCRNDRLAVAAALEAADLRALAGRPLPRLSGGERQRVAFAKLVAQAHEALAAREPYLVLLDEPVANLDPRHQHRLLQEARRMADQGASVLVTLHELALASIYADDVLVLDRGRVAAAGPVATTLTPALVEDVFGVVTAPHVWNGRTILHAVPQAQPA